MMKLKTGVIFILSVILCQAALSAAAPEGLVLQKTDSVRPRDSELGILRAPSGENSQEISELLSELFLEEFAPEEHLHGTTREMLLVLYEKQLSAILPAQRLRFGTIEERGGSTYVPLRLFYREEGRTESIIGSVFLQPESGSLRVVSFDFSYAD